MDKIKKLEDILKELDIPTQSRNIILNDLSEILYFIDNQKTEIQILRKENQELQITLKSKEEVIKMLSGMITGIVDNI